MTTTASLKPNLAAWARGYETLTQEYDYWLEDIEGELPSELQGTLWRNGPGQFELGGVSYRHPFDGDGMVSALTFRDGRVHFRNRYVRTQAFQEEQQAGRILYKNVFGTLKPGGFWANLFDFNNKNVANTNVLYYAQKLWALWEAAPPHRLDPYTLATTGLDPLVGKLPFSAHPRLDPQTGHLVNFGVEVGLQSRLHLWELNPSGKIVRQRVEKLQGLAFIHDFVITPHYAIFFQNPMALDPWPFLFGMKGAAECLHFAKGEPTRILVLPRDGSPVIELEAEPFFIFHHVNAYEQDGLVIIDSIRYEEYLKAQEDRDFKETDFTQIPAGRLWRTTLDLKARRLTTRMHAPRACEFPQVAPNFVGQSHRWAYLASAHAPTANGPMQAVGRFDFVKRLEERYSFDPDGYVGEPVFIPRPGAVEEDGGWVVSLVYRGDVHRTDVIFFDAQNIAAGPIAQLHLPHHVPHGLHGTWSPGFFSKAI
ncbi:carotenoid oxygenase family protein [Anthocerotibacter panamensis]|uniref:carotenoid oxygenase family protein n=1 Tax=Anthocerotibacter panamensis TaxID=2857077 RepID=UPI001C403F7A|nr:carotenoid oxygenase family protein [Anthocerotibacter panamensis]